MRKLTNLSEDGNTCPRYAPQSNFLLTSAAKIIFETLSSSSDARKLKFLWYGVESVNYDVNCFFFFFFFLLDSRLFAVLASYNNWI